MMELLFARPRRRFNLSISQFRRCLSVFLSCLKISDSASAVEFGDNVLRD